MPVHRNISDRGLVDKRYADELMREGFILVESRVSKYSFKVRDYQEKLFNFNQATIDMSIVMKINQYGLSILRKYED